MHLLNHNAIFFWFNQRSAKRLERGTAGLRAWFWFVWCWGSRPNTHHHSSGHIRSFGRGKSTEADQSEVSPL